jgi:thioredoxin 1
MIIELNEENGQFVKDNKLVVMVFSAPWCGSCRMMTSVWDDLSVANEDVTFSKVNVDVNPTLSMEYEVKGVPSIFFIKDGVIVDRHQGATSKSVLQKKIDSVRN